MTSDVINGHISSLFMLLRGYVICYCCLSFTLRPSDLDLSSYVQLLSIFIYIILIIIMFLFTLTARWKGKSPSLFATFKWGFVLKIVFKIINNFSFDWRFRTTIERTYAIIIVLYSIVQQKIILVDPE